jgi:predicted Ser/Thr protein kinase
VPDAQETIFGKVCVERGWATRDQIVGCLREAEGGPAPLSAILVQRGLVTPEQADALRGEVARLLQSGDIEVVRKEDSSLGQILVRKGLAAKEHVIEALSIQDHFARKGGPVPRLGEILVEKGHLPFAVLEEILHLQDRMTRLRCTACGVEYTIPNHEPRRKYLCRRCTGSLAMPPGKDLPPAAPTPMPAPPSPKPSVPDDEEIERAGADPGKRLGKYIMVRELGRGGMGAVYKGWDTELRRWVAIKVLTVKLEGGEELARFQREAQTTAALQHPDIVGIYDVAREGDRHFIVMKFVEGLTLAGQAIPLRRACEIMAQVARAVDYAHDRKVIHRDLKPQNVMIDTSGKPWIMDFGLAKQLTGGLNLTSPGSIVGTPGYMPPEQAAGNLTQVDTRSDIYSLGAILYEIATGQAPYKGANPVETIKMVVSHPLTPPSKINPDVPRDLEAVILKAMEKDKGRRYPTASAFARDLERCMTGEKVTVRRSSRVRDLRRRVRSAPVIAILIAFAILAVILAVLILKL